MTEHGQAHATLGDLLWPALNFAIFAVVMVRALRAPVREYFRERTVRLRESLAAGARARHEAEELRETLAREIADLPALVERLRADTRAAAEQEKGNLIGAGREAAERIRSDARLLAAQELVTARHALQVEVTEETVRQATALIQRALRPDDQERFVRDFVQTAGAFA